MDNNSGAVNSQTGSTIHAPDLSLPKGGGAIKGISESFQPNAFSGTGSYSIPIPSSQARGFEPQLSLNYESGSGNSEWGMGFSLSLPKISRKTDTGIPQYNGEDIYILAGEGELTPKLLKKDDQWVQVIEQKKMDGITWNVLTFLPREQKKYSLIEKWTDPSTGLSWWRVITRNNETINYGKTQQAHIADPNDEARIFEWLIEEENDARGNKILYHYKAENGKNISNKVYELNRCLFAKKYIQRIQYGNYFPSGSRENEKFAFEVVFNYGEYNLSKLNKPDSDPYTPDQEWLERSDPFSSYRSGFEIRTFRLCQGILVFHHFKELGSKPCLVKALELKHDETPAFSFVKSIVKTGYRKDQDGSYVSQSLPPLVLEYSRFSPPTAPEFKPLTINGENTIPGYFAKTAFNSIDLKGEGVPGLLLSNSETTLYYEPLGEGDYSLPTNPARFPITNNLKNPTLSLQSLDANGQLELVVNSPQVTGFFSQELDGGWSALQSFESIPTDTINPFVEKADLNGNGKADLLLMKSPNLDFYQAEGKKGYEAIKQVPLQEEFPIAVNDGEVELVTFADLFGDGLSHRVRIRDGSVEAWPNLGYGHFGKKVTLGNAPRFDSSTKVSRIFLADIDGSGTTDLVFAYADKVEVYLNQAGNSFTSKPVTINLPGIFTDIDQIRFADILGEGTAALVFTKAEPEMSHWYYNFCGEREVIVDGKKSTKPALKPYLLTNVENNLGAATEIHYASSTKFYLQDKKAGRAWTTRLPFPVQVVEKIVTIDEISGARFTSRYAYHDGYFDPVERQFRGFGFVESWDSESFADFNKGKLITDPEWLNKDLYVPPVYTKTWHHTGAFFEDQVITRQYEQEYYQDDKDAYDFPDSVFEPALFKSDAETVRQAYVALKGTVMRQEVYGLDNSADQGNPYTVTEANVDVLFIQPRDRQQYAVFQVNPRESITYHYERNPDDPRVQQGFTLEVDPLCGEITKACTVYLHRRGKDRQPEQKVLKATALYHNYINTPDAEDYRYRGVAYQAQEFEIFGLDLKGAQYCSFTDALPVKSAIDDPIAYQAPITPAQLQARQLTWQRSLFWDQDQKKALPAGKISSRNLLHHIENAVFTKAFVSDIYGSPLTDDTIQQQGGYEFDKQTGYWWNGGLTQFYASDPNAFYVANKTESLFSKTTVEYDQPYYFSAVKVTQYVDIANDVENIITAGIDYMALQPYQVVDINDNVSQALFDPLGQVIVTTLFGTENGQAVGGMRLYPYAGQKAEYNYQTAADFKEVIHQPENYLQGAASYFYYNLSAWQGKSQQPPCAINLVRDNFYHLSHGNSDFSYKISINYSDGFGRELESKLKTDPGLAYVRNDGGALVSGTDDQYLEKQVDERWIVSGRTVYNNKGKPAEQYLPYFSDTPLYETQQEITGQGLVPPPSITQYDPLLRVIRVDTPKGFFSMVEFSPWEEKHFDEDDTVTDSDYYKNFMRHYPAKPTQQQADEKDALDKASEFYDTPDIKVLDSVGHVFQEIEILADKQQLITYMQTDIQGRLILSIDPRLYQSNQTAGKDYYNFKYRYAMGAKDPIYVDSTDAGIERHLPNIFGKQLWSLSPRQYCQLLSYDSIQRRTAVRVKKLPDEQPISSYADFNLVEKYEYGETRPEAKNYNLRGQLYQLNDLSGIVINSQYSLLEDLLETSRQMVLDYKTAIDWGKGPTPLLEKDVYTTQLSYNALKNILAETTPDGSATQNGYNQAGLLNRVSVKFKSKPAQAIVDHIEYDAKGQRQLIQYGNGIITNYSYEETTLRLTALTSTRPKEPGTESVQDVGYTYDPVGNITRSRNKTYETVFHKNSAVEPLSDYTYDALYRLIKADGRQHPGINANTYKNNITDKSFKQCLFSQLPDINDGDKLETYHEIYSYDPAGNLVNKQHNAPSVSWRRETAVKDDSNRLQGLKYDAAGNQRQLEINNTVALSYNCCDNLVKASIIERPDELDDSDYYLYDSNEQRSRKVSERLTNGGVVTTIEEKTYLGNYEIKRVKSVNAQGEVTVTMERQTLRIMDDSKCVAISHYCVIGKEQGSRRLRYQLGDNLDSIAAEYDQTAQLISYEEYFPYGGTAIIAGSNQKEVKLKEYRYSGKERDDSTGLYYYGARYYAPWQGRWLNPDPAGTVDGLNLYCFVIGNPISHVDLDGYMQSSESAKRAFGRTVGIWGRRQKKSGAMLSAKQHFSLGLSSFQSGVAQGKRGSGDTGGRIYLFRVEDKGLIPSKKGETYTTPGNPWTPPRSVSWVKGGISVGAHFVLTTDPTDPDAFSQSRGSHKGELSIYAREVSELLANNYIPIIEARSEFLKKSRSVSYDDEDYLIVMVPGRREVSMELEEDWATVSSKGIGDFYGDFYGGTSSTVTPEDLAGNFEEYIESWATDYKFKLYGREYGGELEDD